MPIGLEFITKTFKGTYSKIAEILEIKPQSVNDWIKGNRKIPKSKLEALSKLFKLDEEYFQKELNEVDKIEIEIIYLKRLSKRDSIEYETTSSDGYDIKEWFNPHENELRIKDEELAIAILTMEIRGLLTDEIFSSDFKQDKHFWILKKISSLLKQDEYFEDEIKGNPIKSEVHDKVDVLASVMSSLVDNFSRAKFNGEKEGFDYELHLLLEKYNIIPVSEDVEVIEEIFDLVDPKYKVDSI